MKRIQRYLWHIARLGAYCKNLGVAGTIKFLYLAVTYKLNIKLKYKLEIFHSSKYNCDIKIRRNSVDIITMGNIVLSGAYDTAFEEIEKNWRIPEKNKMLIIDAGANIGIFTAICQGGGGGTKVPCMDVIAIEPDEDNFKILQQNIQTGKAANCILGGLWGHSGRLKIDNKQDKEYAYTTSEASLQDKGIRAYSMQEIIQQYGVSKIDVLKMDIEGAEYEVFMEKPEEWLDIVECIIIEIHDWLKPHAYELINSKLAENGFSAAAKRVNKEEPVYIYFRV